MNKLVVFLLVVAIGASGAAYYFYRQLSAARQNPAGTSREEIAQLVEQVGRLMVLPEDEEPTVATVSDPTLLKDQPFFTKAKTGDKVLIYTKNRKAVLYDQENNKIVDVAPINIGSSLKSQ